MVADSKTLSRYEKSINDVLTYIVQNVDREFTLEELAQKACFSKFHFLRIFKAIVGETVRDFTRRIRIEKAAYHLIYNPQSSITEIAFDYGFSSSQNFAKSFKGYYGVSPTVFRQNNRETLLQPNSNPGNIISNGVKDISSSISYIAIKEGAPFKIETDNSVAKQVEIKEFPDMELVYVRKNDNYRPDIISKAFEELYSWAKPRGVLGAEDRLITIFWDNVAVTPIDKRRFDASIELKKECQITPPVQKQILPGGLCAVYHCNIEIEHFYIHWNRFLKFWFPRSGFVPDDRPCFEVITNFFDKPESSTVTVDICVPIRKI